MWYFYTFFKIRKKRERNLLRAETAAVIVEGMVKAITNSYGQIRFYSIDKTEDPVRKRRFS
jgi:hypothetical protein